MWKKVVYIFDLIVGWLVVFFSEIEKWQFFKDVWNKIKDGFIKVGEKIKEIVDKVIGKVKEKVEEILVVIVFVLGEVNLFDLVFNFDFLILFELNFMVKMILFFWD